VSGGALQCTIVPYGECHRQRIAELQKRLWSEDASLNLRYLDWKYQRSALRPGLVYVACCGEDVVGMRGFWDSCWEWGHDGERMSCYVADDLVVAPAWENRGVFALLMRHALGDLAARGERLVLNLGASPVNFLASLASGWHAGEALGAMLRESDGPSRLSVLRARLRNTPFLWRFAGHRLLDCAEERRPFEAFDRRARSTLRAQDPALSASSEPRLDAMIDLVTRLGHDGRLRMRRDRAYLQWRLSNPLKARRYLYWGQGDIEGYVVLEKSLSASDDRLAVRILDLEASRRPVMDSLLRAVVHLAGSLEIHAEERSLPADAAPLLKAAGFLPVSERKRLPHLRPAVLMRRLPACAARSAPHVGAFDLTRAGSWDMRRLYGM
jgi:GNAT superfamily N-acetyltransferase